MHGTTRIYRKSVVNPGLLDLALVSRSYYGYFLALVISLNPLFAGILADKKTYKPISKKQLMGVLKIQSMNTLDLFFNVLEEKGMLEEVTVGEQVYLRITVLPEYQCGVKNVDKAKEILSDLVTGKISLDQIQRKPHRKESSSPFKTQVIEDHIKENYAGYEYLIRILIEKLKETRTTKKISDNKMIEILTAMIPYPSWKVIQGVQTYLVRRYWAEGKNERYLMGIIRGQKVQGAVSVVSKESIKRDLMKEYGYEERWDQERFDYMMRSIEPKIEERWEAYIKSLK